MIRTTAFEAMMRLSEIRHGMQAILNTQTAICAPHYALQKAIDSIGEATLKLSEAYAESVYIETDPANKEVPF